jgi:hypothetical protein
MQRVRYRELCCMARPPGPGWNEIRDWILLAAKLPMIIPAA